MVNKIRSLLLDALFPYECVLCRLPSARPLPLCLPCQLELPGNPHPCRICALPLGEDAEICGACLQRAPTYTRVVAPLLYSGDAADFVRRLKYRGDMTMLPLLSHLLAESLQPLLDTGPAPDALLPMPLHWRRLCGRGFNQADRIARALRDNPLLRRHRLRVEPRLCRRIRPTAAQAGLDRLARQRNLIGAFRATPRVGGLHIAVVDDVLTTGASAEIISQVLMDMGARRVDIWCCARTPAPAERAAL